MKIGGKVVLYATYEAQPDRGIDRAIDRFMGVDHRASGYNLLKGVRDLEYELSEASANEALEIAGHLNGGIVLRGAVVAISDKMPELF
jgi:hypothetical protein